MGPVTDYAAGSSYTLPASGTDTLYAQWDPNTVTLAYDANGGSGAPGDQSGDAFSDVTVSDTTPTREGYSFTGWNTAADGTGVDYPAGSSYTLPASGTDTLYAQWNQDVVGQATLAYSANGGSGAPGDQSGDASSDVTVSDTTPTRRGIPLRVGTLLRMGPVLIMRLVRRTRCRLRGRTRCMPSGIPIRSRWRMTRMVVRGLRVIRVVMRSVM